MPATLTIPRTDPLQFNPVPRPSNILLAPKEGNKVCNFSVNWGNDSAANGAIAVNIQGSNSTNPFSQIVAVYVNNLMSNVDAVFKFPASQFQLTVPAQSEGLYPVDAQSLDFVVQAAGGAWSTSDMLFVSLYNYMPPPIAIARAFLTSTVQVNGIGLTAPGTSLITSGPGVVTAVQAELTNVVGGAAAGTVNVALTDAGSGNVLASGSFTVGAGVVLSGPQVLINVSGVNLIYTGNLNAVVTTSGTALVSGNLNVVVYRR